MKSLIDMEQVRQQAIEALRNGIMRVCVAGMWFPIHFIHADEHAQYGLMTAFGEIVRLVQYSADNIAGYLV